MGLLPRATLHAAAPSQSKKNKKKQNDIQLQRHEEQWHRRGEEAAEAAARYRVCEKKTKQNKTKQAKHNNAERSGCQIASRPTRR